MVSHGPEIELLVNGVTGLFCRDGDVSAFAQAICTLLTNESKRKKMSENALRIIQQKYNVNNMAKGITDAVRYCVENNGCALAD